MTKRRVAVAGTMTGSVLGALDGMEPELRHLNGLIAVFRILGEADDSIEPVVVSSLARCARETLRSSSETGARPSALQESADCGNLWRRRCC